MITAFKRGQEDPQALKLTLDSGVVSQIDYILVSQQLKNNGIELPDQDRETIQQVITDSIEQSIENDKFPKVLHDIVTNHKFAEASSYMADELLKLKTDDNKLDLNDQEKMTNLVKLGAEKMRDTFQSYLSPNLPSTHNIIGSLSSQSSSPLKHSGQVSLTSHNQQLGG